MAISRLSLVAYALTSLTERSTSSSHHLLMIHFPSRRGIIRRAICFRPAKYLRTFTGVETAALTFRTKQYSTGYSSHIYYGKRFYNDFFLNHHTLALSHSCLKMLSCVAIETALDGMKKNQLILTVSFQLENVHLTSSRTVLNAMIAMHVNRQL